MAEILIVDDDEPICATLSHFLTVDGHQPSVVSNAEEMMRVVEASPPDLVLLDIRLPGMDGLEALRRLNSLAPELDVVMMTAYGTSQTTIEAMRLGAFDYLSKPFDLESLKSVIDKALEKRALSREAAPLARDHRESDRRRSLVGSSPRMQEVYKLIGLLSARPLAASLVGERGTGKRLVARTIHQAGGRRGGHFVSVSCRALPENDLAAELFGREAASTAHGPAVLARGRLEAAGNGTVFLEHVESLSLALQARLLQFLQHGEIERIGGVEPVPVNAQLLAATELDLGDLVRRGTFSEELLDELRVFSIELPPLRDRREDLPELIAHFIERSNSELGGSIRGVDERVTALFEKYPWPGNVGELENVIRRAAAIARGEVITPDDLGDSLREGWYARREEAESGLAMSVRRVWRQRLGANDSKPRGPAFHEIVAKVEETLVREALNETSGNQVRAARLLGITRTTLRKKMERFGL